MSKNKAENLRTQLFKTRETLKKTIEMLEDGEMDLETAKGIAQLGQASVNVTKLEISWARGEKPLFV